MSHRDFYSKQIFNQLRYSYNYVHFLQCITENHAIYFLYKTFKNHVYSRSKPCHCSGVFQSRNVQLECMLTINKQFCQTSHMLLY